MKTSRLAVAAIAAVSLGAGLRSRSAARVAAAASTALPYYASGEFTAEWLSPERAAGDSFHRVAPFALRNQRGEVVSDRSLAGRIYVANFFFSACQGICPRMVANLRRIQAAFRDDPEVLLVSHTVMPSHDSIAVLESYAEKNGVEPGKWHLLTGDKETIYGLARRSYFAEKPSASGDPNDFLHTENMLLVDRHGHLRGVFNATLPAEADRAIEEIRQLRREP